MIIVYFFITEFLPDILALDSSFLATYIVEDKIHEDGDSEKRSKRSLRKVSDQVVNSCDPDGGKIINNLI